MYPVQLSTERAHLPVLRRGEFTKTSIFALKSPPPRTWTEHCVHGAIPPRLARAEPIRQDRILLRCDLLLFANHSFPLLSQYKWSCSSCAALNSCFSRLRLLVLHSGPESTFMSALSVFDFSIADSLTSICLIPLNPMTHLAMGVRALASFLLFY